MVPSSLGFAPNVTRLPGQHYHLAGHHGECGRGGRLTGHHGEVPVGIEEETELAGLERGEGLDPANGPARGRIRDVDVDVDGPAAGQVGHLGVNRGRRQLDVAEVVDPENLRP